MDNSYLEWQIKVYGRGAGGGSRRQGPYVAAKKRIRAAQLGRCLYCELPIGVRVKRDGRAVALTAHWDHFIPFSYLAQNPEANWVLSCQVCNGIKSDRMFRTVEEAREVIVRQREIKGYESIAETVAKMKPRKPRRAAPTVKSRPKPKAKPASRCAPAPRRLMVRALPKGALAHGCGAWWTGGGKSHCPSCCQTFATERVALVHRVGEGGARRCLPPEAAGLVAVSRPWGTCWEKPKPSAPT